MSILRKFGFKIERLNNQLKRISCKKERRRERENDEKEREKEREGRKRETETEREGERDGGVRLFRALMVSEKTLLMWMPLI